MTDLRLEINGLSAGYNGVAGRPRPLAVGERRRGRRAARPERRGQDDDAADRVRAAAHHRRRDQRARAERVAPGGAQDRAFGSRARPRGPIAVLPADRGREPAPRGRTRQGRHRARARVLPRARTVDGSARRAALRRRAADARDGSSAHRAAQAAHRRRAQPRARADHRRTTPARCCATSRTRPGPACCSSSSTSTSPSRSPTAPTCCRTAISCLTNDAGHLRDNRHLLEASYVGGGATRGGPEQDK